MDNFKETKDPKSLIDSKDLDAEFDKLIKRYELLDKRFLAISLDYKYYINSSNFETQIFELRDSILYRIYGAYFHTSLLIDKYLEIEREINDLYKSEPNNSIDFQNLLYISSKQISTLFDSIIYHLSSVFDYIGNLINYICGEKGKNNDTLKWTSLCVAFRDKKNNFSKKKISLIISKVNNDFVDKLYTHRSHLIHNKQDIGDINVSYTFSGSTIKTRFIATNKFCNGFHELRKTSQEHNLTLNFVCFWLINKSFDIINEILFALRDEIASMEKLPLQERISDNDLIPLYIKNNQMFSPSAPYWELEE